MPPTTEVTAKQVASTGTQMLDAVTRMAAAAGVTSKDSTSSAPTICTDMATARPSTTMKIGDSARTGTPLAAAISGSTVANINGRHMTVSEPRTTTVITDSQTSCGSSTATI